MKSTIEQVKEWHEQFNVLVTDAPHVADPRLNKLRVALLKEELAELEAALAAGDAVETLDALTDLQYVLDGAYLSLGFWKYKDAAFAEVQRSNMSKLGHDGKPFLRDDGKVLKGPNYKAPDLEKVVAQRI